MLANIDSRRDIPRVTLLGPANWEDWKMQVELLFEVAGVQAYINNTVTKGQFDKQKNSQALLLLLSSISVDLKKSLRDAGYKKAMPAWQALALLESVMPKPSPPPTFDMLKEMMSLDRANFPTLKALLDRFHYLWEGVAKKETLTDWCWTNIALSAIKNTNPKWHHHWHNKLAKEGETRRELNEFLVLMAHSEAKENASAAARQLPDNIAGGNAGQTFYTPVGVVGNGMFNQPTGPATVACGCLLSQDGVSHRIGECVYHPLPNNINFQQYQNAHMFEGPAFDAPSSIDTSTNLF